LSEFGTHGINARNAGAILQEGTYSLLRGVPKWVTVYKNALWMPLEVEICRLIPDGNIRHTEKKLWNYRNPEDLTTGISR
jgi:hypothetical protein